MMAYCELDHKESIGINFEWNTENLIQEIHFELSPAKYRPYSSGPIVLG